MTRPADENDECGTCERCNGNPLVTCNAHSRDEGEGCFDDCTHCSSGSCVNRAQCATAECSSDEYCDQAGGDCTNPDTNSQAGERACQNCITGGQHPYGEGWGFEAGTPYCCGDDSGEYHQARSCSSGCSSDNTDTVCCNNGNDCVYSGTCYSGGSLCAPWNSDAIGSCSSGTWSQTENCATKPSVDSGDSGNDPTDYGSCIDYLTCASAACTSTTLNDVCTSSTQLTEYYASGSGGSWDISISCSPTSGGVGTNVAVPIAIQGNSQAIETFGLEFTYDTGLLQYLSVSPGSLTGTWAAVDGGDVSGTVTVGGFRGSGSWIPAGSSGTIAVVNLRVISGSYGGGNPIDLCIMNYMDGITGMTPDPYCISSCASASESCSSATYTCNDFETLATGDVSDNPATTGTCTAGNGAGCASGQFSTTAGTGSGTEGCVDSNACFSNGGSGGGNCVFKEYYAVDSADSCGGLDSCTSKTYDPDTNSNTCNQCAGSNRFGIGGEDCNGASTGNCATQCCGDDSNEYRRTCQDGGEGACAESTDDIGCCNNANDCVYNNQCYSNTQIANNLWICDQGTWRRLGVSVSVIATPSSVTTTWQNTDATASVSCTPDSPVIQCDSTSYALYTSSTSISSCSTTYSDYTLSDPQTISSHVWVCAAAMDTFGTEGFSSPVEFLVDKINPTASLSPLPAWTNQNSVTVDWVGSDTGGSGIWRFDLHYRITTIDGAVIQGWTLWANPTSNPGSRTFLNMTNNRTYQFRIRARDNAGNIGGWSSTVGISVDLVDPTCQMANLPMYTTSSSFIVSWSGSDGESGIQYYNIQVRVGESGTWGYLNNPDGCHTTETWDNVNGADGNTYFFRCNATDVAGNEGPWSPVVNTTVDATPPISSVDPLPPWLNLNSFTVSWNGSDGTSGIDCYDIQFDDGSGWSDWFTCTTSLSSTFGPDSPVNVTENMTYSFRSRATDNAGNVEGWPPQPDTYTTIDLTPPQYDLRAYDQDGREITGFVQNVDTVTIRSVATDSISGVQNNYVRYTLLNDAGETAGSQDCGSASPYGGVSECNVTVDFAGAITLEFWVEVIDRAGNRVISGVLYIGTHPLVNFREHSVYMSMGEIRTLGIQVRNMQNQADNVTITLSSNMPVAPYFVWVDDPDVEITGTNNQTLIVSNLNPSATPPPFYVLVWSPDEVRNYQLALDAFSALNITDSDDAIVQVGYPASFPGLNEWAIFVLIILAVFGYVWFGKEIK